jgi:hypothetical protein
VGVCQPYRLSQPEEAEEVVDPAVGAIEQCAPSDRRANRRHQQWQGVDDTKNTGSSHAPSQQKRERDTSRSFYRKAEANEDVGVLDDEAQAGGARGLEYRAEDAPVVHEAHPSNRECPRDDKGETEDHGDNQGHAGDSDEQDEAGYGGEPEEPFVEPGPKSRRHATATGI